MKLLPTLLLSVLVMSSVLAVDMYYAIDDAEQITGDELRRTETIRGEEEFLYLFSPTDFKQMTFTLSGSSGYKPRLSFWDASDKTHLEQINVNYGEVITVDYIGGYKNGQPKKYMLVVETIINDGEQFVLDYKAVAQNDLGTGTDGHYRFRNAQTLTQTGLLNGFLGDEDIIDYFAINVGAGEDLDFRLSPSDKDSLRLTLIDGSYTTKIDQRAQLQGETLTATYNSPREQTIWIGIEGTAPYVLDFKRSSSPVVGNDEPPLPPPLPGIDAPSIDNPIVGVGVDDNQNPPPSTDVDETKKSSSTLGVILILVVLVLIAVAIWYLKTQKGPVPAEEKTDNKTPKAKKTDKKAEK